MHEVFDHKMDVYRYWDSTADNLESAERFGCVYLANGWNYTTSIQCPDYEYEDYECL